jgi:hypothetical protein
VAPPLDVTVVVPAALRAAFGGRSEVQLGVPAGASVGDVLETLLILYPRLYGLLPSDGDGHRPDVHLLLSEHASQELAQGRGGLAGGQRLFLFAGPPSPGGRPGVGD